jgi:hypothetical protein
MAISEPAVKWINRPHNLSVVEPEGCPPKVDSPALSSKIDKPEGCPPKVDSPVLSSKIDKPEGCPPKVD